MVFMRPWLMGVIAFCWWRVCIPYVFSTLPLVILLPPVICVFSFRRISSSMPALITSFPAPISIILATVRPSVMSIVRMSPSSLTWTRVIRRIDAIRLFLEVQGFDFETLLLLSMFEMLFDEIACCEDF